MTPEEKAAKKAEYAREYQRRLRLDPVRYAKHKEANKASRKKRFLERPAESRAKSAQQVREWREKNKPRYAARRLALRKANMSYFLLEAARRRAKMKGLEIDLTETDIVVPEFCPVLGLKLEPQIKSPRANSPTLDRVDNSKGYIKGNVKVVSYRANSLKKDATLGEVLAVYEYMLSERMS